jgi:hypothetical protein
MKLTVIHTPFNGINLLALLQMGYRKAYLSKDFIFTEESKYETKNPDDQKDWNKLTGLASLAFNSQKSSHMWAWRYFNGNFEIAPYSHDSKGTIIFPEEKDIIVVKQDVVFHVDILILNNNDVLFHFNQQSNKIKEIIKKNELLPKNNYRIITTWFGGTSLPKKIVKIYGL